MCIRDRYQRRVHGGGCYLVLNSKRMQRSMKESMATMSRIGASLNCGNHPDVKASFFCNACDDMVCKDCMGDHSGHSQKMLPLKSTLDFVNGRANKQINALSKMITTLRTKLADAEASPLLRGSTGFKRDISTQLESIKRKVISRIEELFDNLISELDSEMRGANDDKRASVFETFNDEYLRNIRELERVLTMLNGQTEFDLGFFKEIVEPKYFDKFKKMEELYESSLEQMERELGEDGADPATRGGSRVVIMNPYLQTTIVGVVKSLLEKRNFLCEGHYALNTYYPPVEKNLHWFEWKTKNLHLYSLERKDYIRVELDIGFFIPEFARSVATAHGHIFLVGGRNPVTKKNVRSVYVYNSSLSRTKLYEMKDLKVTGRGDHILVYCNNKLFVIGGKDENNESTLKCERYDIGANKWEEIDQLTEPRVAGTGAVVDEKFIYVVGGTSKISSICESIERYSIANDKWSQIKIRLADSLLNSRIFGRLSTALQIGQSKLLIAGGMNLNSQATKSAFVLDLATNSLDKFVELPFESIFTEPPVFNTKRGYLTSLINKKDGSISWNTRQVFVVSEENITILS
eukprot:TRINITY_DN2952_c0_g2_i1.p1 TRINITY_DN2952_c0_g2~~TRINITY_DN2952_c0_g2_i1.p1  ORF type:complete len:577 (+),score=114.28 TRINITY_DN2952_c0_g2_i1:66-1796(+)